MHPTKAGHKFIRLIHPSFGALILISALFSCQQPRLTQQRFLQFGTLIDITLITDNEAQAEKLYQQIERLLIRRHFEWHGWLDGTLKQFNQSLTAQSGRGTAIPETLETLIQESKKFYQTSDGLFNPAMGKLISAWGFHQDSGMNDELIRQIQENIPGMHDLVIKNDLAYSKNPYLQLDFGAIAKGLAIQQIAELLKHHRVKNFIINAGGDIYTEGKKHSKHWRIAIENPFESGIIGGLDMSSGSSIFSSGNYRRFFDDENENQPRRHHIIHPKTGKPSEYISAATVIHNNPVTADAAATTLMLTDVAQLKNMAARFEIQHYLVITEQHEIYASESMLKKIDWIKPHDFTIHVL